MTATKAELTRDIVEAVGLTQREAKEMVDAFFGNRCLSHARRGSKAVGLGAFETRDKVERPGRNPLTGSGHGHGAPGRRLRASRDLKSVAGKMTVPERVRKVG